ncbi:MAG: helix-hairpin-helix domain-containing protein [Chloroflexota bacterium]|nr:helix-hairpin-helix domain-containing protein [Chloroflexota bacterium]
MAVNQPIRIVIDTAEQRSAVYRMLADLPEITIEVARLPTGDYLLGGGLAVERKTGADFAASIVDRRLFAQVTALKAAYERPVVLIEGTLPPPRTRMHPHALRGALSYLVAIEGLSVLRTNDAEDTALLLVQLARHTQHGLKTPPSTVATPRSRDLAQQQERIVAALPEVGPTLGRQLLAAFGSIARIIAATASELQAVPGIGPARAGAIRHALDTPYLPSAAQEQTAPDGPGWLVPPSTNDDRRRRKAVEGREDGSG